MNSLADVFRFVFGHRYSKGILLLVLGLLVAFYWARGTVALSNRLTIGGLGKALAVPLIFQILFVLVLVTDFQRFTLPLPSSISAKQIALLVALTPLTVYLATKTSLRSDLTYLVIGLGTAVGSAISLLFVLTRESIDGFAIFLLVLPFINWLEREFGGTWTSLYYGTPLSQVLISPSFVLLWALVAATIIKRFVLRHQRWVGTPLDRYILAFVGFLLLSSVLSRDPFRSLRNFYQVGICMPLLFFLVVHHVRNRQQMERFLWSMLLYAFLKTSLFYYLYAVGTGYQLRPLLRAHESFPISSLLGMISVSLFPLSISLLWTTRDWSMKRLLALASTVAFLVATTFAKERSFVLVLAMFTLPFLWLTLHRARKYLLLALLVLLLVALPFHSMIRAELFDRFSSWTSLQSIQNDQALRLDGLQAALRMMRDYPLGIGLGMWHDYIPFYAKHVVWLKVDRLWRQPWYAATPHNIFLDYGAYGGVGTLLAFVAIVIVVLRRAFALLRVKEDDRLYTLAVGTTGWWGAFMVNAVVNGGPLRYFWGLDQGMMFWMPIGLLMIWDRAVARENGGASE